MVPHDDDDGMMMFEGVSDIFVTYQDHHKRLRLAHLLPSLLSSAELEFQFWDQASELESVFPNPFFFL